MPNIVIGTAGHIDHGKSALVKALTGIDPDRLKEEKERGITIDIGFASLRLDGGTTLGFIDVPGHERFIKNMLAGVGGIDMVMLVIAADEGVMPQTREHLDICSLLQVSCGLTVLTKIDAVDAELVDLAEIEVQEFLKGSFLEGAPVLRVSSVTGAGVPALVETLADLAARVPERDAGQITRLPIDRCFTMKGFGTVVSGTLIAGRVRRDEDVEILPACLAARVRGIQVHGAPVDEARAGQRTALNLQRIELGEVARGMVVVPPNVFQSTRALDVRVTLLASAAAPVVRRKRIRFHLGTAELIGYVVLLGRDLLEPGDRALAQILLEEPTLALPGDRFIVRQYSPMLTIGGGEVLDAHPPRHRRSDPAVVERLERLQRAALDERVLLLVQESGPHVTQIADLVGRIGLPVERVAAVLWSLAAEGRVQIVGDTPLAAVATEAFTRAATAILGEISGFHHAEPLLPGIGREDLKGRLRDVASSRLFDAVIERLTTERKVAVEQELVHLFDRRVTLAGEEALLRNRLEERFRSLGLQAPAVDEVIGGLGVDKTTARKIVQLMVKENLLVKIREETAVDRAALQKVIADVRALKAVSPRLGVPEFKALTGLSRKFAVPLLEYLDGQRITRRVGDERVIL